MKINEEVYVSTIGGDKPITKTRITELWASDDRPGYMLQGFDNRVFTEDQIATTPGKLIDKNSQLRIWLVKEI
jgi:hypothetical protein